MNKTQDQQQTVAEEDELYKLCVDETPKQRAQRLYASEGGPLVSWLFDEAHRRRHTNQEMAAELNVTYGYISQLRSGLRSVENVSHEFARACASYLGVPTIAIKLISGSIRLSDFALPSQSEEELIDRAYRQMASDTSVKYALPAHSDVLSHEAKKALVMMYSDVSGEDLLGVQQLPDIVCWLQMAAIVHNGMQCRAKKQCAEREKSSSK